MVGDRAVAKTRDKGYGIRDKGKGQGIGDRIRDSSKNSSVVKIFGAPAHTTNS